VTLPRELVRRHDPNALTPVVHLSAPFVASPGAAGMTARAYVEREAASENDLVDLFLAVLLGISVGYTSLAVANTVLMATYGRRQELVTLHRTAHRRDPGADRARRARRVTPRCGARRGAGTRGGRARAV
jgi:putative ABC transport system permease protein